LQALDPATIAINNLPSVSFAQRGDLPNQPGIYFVLDAQRTVHYIGRAKRLCFRWVTHHRLADFRKMDTLAIAYVTVSDPELLPAIEQAMIAYFDPPLNRRQYSEHPICATIHLKMSPALRNSILGKLRARGTTMQSFFVGIMEMIVADEDFFDLLERKRNDFREQREPVHS